MKIYFLFVKAAIEKYSIKIGVKIFRYDELHWSCPGVVVKTFEEYTSEGNTKIIIFFKEAVP